MKIRAHLKSCCTFWEPTGARRISLYFLMFFLVALVILRFLGYYFARKISGPIEILSEISTEVAKGNLSKSVPVNTNDEIGELAKNFNHMIEGLREWERIKMVEFELEKGQKIQKDSV